MSQSYINDPIDVISTHQKNQQNQQKFYKSTYDLLGLLIWFQKKHSNYFGTTQWLANKLGVTKRAILFQLSKLEKEGLIMRIKQANKRVIICDLDAIKDHRSTAKISPLKKPKFHHPTSIKGTGIHNTNKDVDVVIGALKNEGIQPTIARSLAQRYSKQRIREVINASRKQSEISNKPGWIVRALSANFNFESGRIEEPPKYQLFQRQTQASDRSGYKAGIAMIRERLGIVRG
jgi:DNA-binding Lrp family transcriptional regulator